MGFKKLLRRTFIGGSLFVAAVAVASQFRSWQLWLGSVYFFGAPHFISVGFYDGTIPVDPPPGDPFVQFGVLPRHFWAIDYLQLPDIDTRQGQQVSVPWWAVGVLWGLVAWGVWYSGRRGRAGRGFPVQTP